MSIQGQQVFSMRWLRISVLAVLAVALLTGAPLWFGSGLRADTSRSVARSPLGSSLTAVRESRLDDYFGRLSNSSVTSGASSLAAVSGSRLDDYCGRMSKPARADSRLDDYFARH
jgi:hypothetical protein